MSKKQDPVSRSPARIYFELATVLLVGIGKFVVGDWFRQKFAFVVVGCGLLIAFIAIRGLQHPSVLKEWGFTKNNFAASMKRIAPFAVLSMLGFFLYGAKTLHAFVDWHIWAVFFLYPVWGIIQQFLVAVLLAGNLDRLSGGRIPRPVIVLTTAALFALVHVPSLPLVLAAFALGCVTTASFLRYRNVWTIGIFHGWFATFLYFFVLGFDPLQDLLS
ncbi:MAG TPA: CPBP family glutamic-type intramembrane protease [bacterium]